MYDWEIEAMERPWKTRCPHCRESFPTNDFSRFYRSGLDRHGVFDPQRADRSLLFNPSIPTRMTRCISTEWMMARATWMATSGGGSSARIWFTGSGSRRCWEASSKLAAAYVVTGDKRYAHKAAVMLDRVADLYPTFDFQTQAWLYEAVRGAATSRFGTMRAKRLANWPWPTTRSSRVSTDDQELVSFLRARRAVSRCRTRSIAFRTIRANIEGRILRDALANTAEDLVELPADDIAVAIIKAMLAWPRNREEILGHRRRLPRPGHGGGRRDRRKGPGQLLGV